MIRKFFVRNIPLLLFLVSLLTLVAYKFPHFSLPFFQDEAWVYGKAVRYMADHGVSMMPNALELEVGRGHPLLFHAFYASLLSFFGNTIFNAHLIAFMFSLALLIFVFLFFERSVGKWSGLFVAGLLMLQPVFLAQFALVLPEIPLTLFTLLSLYFYSKKKLLFYWLSASVAVLLKETALVLFPVLILYECVLGQRTKLAWFQVIKNFPQISLPVLFWFVHLVVHRYQMGTWFFHEHTGYISFDSMEFLSKLERLFYFVFLAQGRNIFFFAFLFFLIYSFFTARLRLDISMLLPLFFIVVFFIFSALNYYADRYAVVAVFCFVICVVFLIWKSAIHKSWKLLAFAVSSTSALFSVLTLSSGNDHNLGYVDSVKTGMQCVNYMTKNLSQNDTIYTWFNTHKNLQSHYAGYIHEDYFFSNLRTDYRYAARYFVFSDIENPNEKDILTKQMSLVLLTRFENGKSWMEIYKRQ